MATRSASPSGRPGPGARLLDARRLTYVSRHGSPTRHVVAGTSIALGASTGIEAMTSTSGPDGSQESRAEESWHSSCLRNRAARGARQLDRTFFWTLLGLGVLASGGGAWWLGGESLGPGCAGAPRRQSDGPDDQKPDGCDHQIGRKAVGGAIVCGLGGPLRVGDGNRGWPGFAIRPVGSRCRHPGPRVRHLALRIGGLPRRSRLPESRGDRDARDGHVSADPSGAVATLRGRGRAGARTRVKAAAEPNGRPPLRGAAERLCSEALRDLWGRSPFLSPRPGSRFVDGMARAFLLACRGLPRPLPRQRRLCRAGQG